MNKHDVVIATFDDHLHADAAVKRLIHGGFDMKHFSVVGKGYHSEEKIAGFYNVGDRMRFWGRYGAFWGGLWGLLFGGVFLTVPVLGPLVVLGHLATIVLSVIEGAVVVGGFSALGAAIASMAIPKDSIVKYETAIKSNHFLVMGHGSPDEMARARAALEGCDPADLDLHQALMPHAVAPQDVPVTL